MTKSIKIILAILFFACLAKMPYGFYVLVRIVAMAGFCALAYYAYEQNKKTAVIVYIALAVLFQPLLKIPLGHEVWNVVDVIVAVGLLVSVFIGH